MQAAAGRVQSCRLVDDVMGLARAARFRSVQLEVVCGLPGQDMARWQRTLECLLWLGPERIRVLPLRAGSPACGSPLAELPDPELRERLWRCAVDRLSAAGYHRIGDELFVLEDDLLALAAQAGRLRRAGEAYVDQPVAARFAFGPGAPAARRAVCWPGTNPRATRGSRRSPAAAGRWPACARPARWSRRAAPRPTSCCARAACPPAWCRRCPRATGTGWPKTRRAAGWCAASTAGP
ncbi:MAG: hypothetical protein MZW92_04820 [Comamonadaceae bacterium]|nr:hypothetical protein [Comamonadaceae bacterium]